LASNWWLFIGTALCCSGFLLPVGIILLVWWFIDYLSARNSPIINTGKQYIENTFNINNVNIHSDGKDHSSDDDYDTPMDHMSRDTKEDMR
tara:strand:+ start:144 stop:416 length:273 start_codon:yes stop_codon:yes gene_type:complete